MTDLPSLIARLRQHQNWRAGIDPVRPDPAEVIRDTEAAIRLLQEMQAVNELSHDAAADPFA